MRKTLLFAVLITCVGAQAMPLGLRTAMWGVAAAQRGDGGDLPPEPPTPDTCTVAFNANGGVGELTAQAFTNGVEQALAANAFTRQGFKFLGWATVADGAVVYADRQSVAISEDTTLYAVWEENEPEPEPWDPTTIRIDTDDGYETKADGSFSLDLGQLILSATAPTVTVKGLPAGIKFDSRKGMISGKATKPGVYKVTVTAKSKTVKTPVTATFELVVPNLGSEVLPNLEPATDAYGIVICGVALEPGRINCTPEKGWTVKVSGLPAGLKYDAKTGKITGVPTKAGTFTVTFTATKGKEKEVATITVGVAALPEWAYGTYDGAYFEFDGEVTNAVGQVTATVSSAGKVSGKIQKGGKSYSFAAASFGGYDPDDGVFTALVTVPWSRTDSEEFLLTVGASESGLGSVTLEPVGDGAHYAEAVQNAWLRKDVALPAFAAGAGQPVLVLAKAACCGMESYDLVCKFGAKGVVTVSGTVNGVAATSKPQLLAAVWDGEMLVGSFVVYVANAKLDNGAYCHVFDVVLSDTDEDGKLDFAAVPEG